MSNLIKENNIFEEVEKRCKSFIDNDPLINAYRKKEWNEYFHKEMMDIEKNKVRFEEKETMARAMKKENMDIEIIKK